MGYFFVVVIVVVDGRRILLNAGKGKIKTGAVCLPEICMLVVTVRQSIKRKKK